LRAGFQGLCLPISLQNNYPADKYQQGKAVMIMLGGNSFITIWNRIGNIYKRHEVNVKCRYTQKSISDHSGARDSMRANVSSVIICRIPYNEFYKSPPDWQELPEEEQGKYFTVQADDYIALGIQKYEIGKDKESGEITIPELRNKLHSDVMQAKGVRYSLHTTLGKHIRAEGV